MWPETPEAEAKEEETGGRCEAGSAGFRRGSAERAPMGQSLGSLSRGQQGSSFSGFWTNSAHWKGGPCFAS